MASKVLNESGWGELLDVRNLSDEVLQTLAIEAMVHVRRRGGDIRELRRRATAEADVNSPFDLLNPRQQERGKAISHAMAAAFDVPERSFAFIKTTGEEGIEIAAVAYGAVRGLTLESRRRGRMPNNRTFEDIMASDRLNNSRFVLNVDGTTVDTRTGSNLWVYQALVESAIDFGAAVPDMPYSVRGLEASRTLLTGAGSDYRYAIAGHVSETGTIGYDRPIVNQQHSDVLWRPMALIEV